jgi:hypothetical protein
MNTYSTYRALTPLQLAAVMDSAKRRAKQARREAIDDFWGAVAQLVRSSWRALTRVVSRRVERHQEDHEAITEHQRCGDQRQQHGPRPA